MRQPRLISAMKSLSSLRDLARSSANAASRFPAARNNAPPSRALWCEIPKILILDDALSSVDTFTEERILQGLAEAMRGRTTIFISHRVSTVRHADQIAVLVDGSIVELGTHDELVARNGYYTQLHEKQMLEEELSVVS